jgi:hypothetical protein
MAFRLVIRPALALVRLAAYQEAGLLASGTVSLTTSHRRKTQAFRSALASACRNTTAFSGRNEITKSSPSGRIATFRLSGRLIIPIRSDMKAPPLADPPLPRARKVSAQGSNNSGARFVVTCDGKATMVPQRVPSAGGPGAGLTCHCRSVASDGPAAGGHRQSTRGPAALNGDPRGSALHRHRYRQAIGAAEAGGSISGERQPQ